MSRTKKMAASKSVDPAVSSPWGDAGSEITEPGIGVGFVDWQHLGEHLRGVVGRRWRSRAMRSPALTLELTEPPEVEVINTEGDGEPKPVDVKVGDKVNLSLTHDLARKLTEDKEGEEVGIQYVNDLPTRGGSMRVFRVVSFGPRDARR